MERISFLSFSQIGSIVLQVLLLFHFPSLGQAAQVSLAWDTSTDPIVASYKIYSGTSSSIYSQNVNVGLTNTYTVTNLTEGQTYYFAATAIGSNGLESGYSNEVSYTVPLSQTISTITASAGTNGTISPSGSVFLTQGSSQSFTIQPNTNYQIANVVVDGTSVGAVGSYAFSNVTASHTITASFTPLTYILSVIKNGTGSGSVSSNPTGTSFSAGPLVTLSAAPDANSVFSGWSDGCSGTATSCQVTMNSNVSVTATFIAVIKPPIVATGSATLVTSSSATLNGTVNPNGLSTINIFQWGRTTSYGNATA